MRGTWSGVSATIEAGSGRDSTGRGGLVRIPPSAPIDII